MTDFQINLTFTLLFSNLCELTKVFKFVRSTISFYQKNHLQNILFKIRKVIHYWIKKSNSLLSLLSEDLLLFSLFFKYT